MKTNVSNSMNECGLTQQIMDKFMEKVRQTPTRGSEPGVEITRNLSCIIERTIHESIYSDCDISLVAQDVMVNAFRCDHSILEEAHKTIHLLIKEILQPVFGYKGNIHRTIDGLLNGIKIIAQEQGLNREVAVGIAKEDILFWVEKIAPGYVHQIQERLNDI